MSQKCLALPVFAARFTETFIHLMKTYLFSRIFNITFFLIVNKRFILSGMKSALKCS